jgi:DNA-directed RNA polymerase specialized sigma24 family protein
MVETPSRQDVWRAAFENLAITTRPKLMIHARTLTRGSSMPHSPEDLIQTALESIYTRYPLLHPISEKLFLGYCRQTLTHIVRKYYRSSKKLEEPNFADDPFVKIPARHIVPEPDLSPAITTALAILTQEEKLVIQVAADMSASGDAATWLDMPESHYLQTLSEAREKLQPALAKPRRQVGKLREFRSERAPIGQSLDQKYPFSIRDLAIRLKRSESWVRERVKLYEGTDDIHVQNAPIGITYLRFTPRVLIELEQIKTTVSIEYISRCLGVSRTWVSRRLALHPNVGKIKEVFHRKEYPPEIIEHLRPEAERWKESLATRQKLLDDPLYYWRDENQLKVVQQQLRLLAKHLGRQELTDSEIQEANNTGWGPYLKDVYLYWPTLDEALRAAGLCSPAA